MKLGLAVLFLLLALLSGVAVIGFFAFGVPLSLLFVSLAIWKFAEWHYKKEIPGKTAVILFVLPVMGLLALLTANDNGPSNELLSSLLSPIEYILSIAAIIYFFRKVRNA